MSKVLEPLRFDEFPSYRGGSTLYDGSYIWEFAPDHRLRNKWGWVPQAWLVAEDKYGRPLYRDPDPHRSECVHHKDECKTNNHPDNLEIMTRIQHWRYHARKTGEQNRHPVTELQAERALQKTGSLYKAAGLLGCCPQTLRNRFPDAVKPYLRKSPFLGHRDPALVAKVLVWAKDPAMRAADIDWEPRLSQETAREVCKKNGIRWLRRSRKGEVRKTYKGRPTTKDPRIVEKVRGWVKLGKSVKRIADRLGFSPDTVRALCRANGIPYKKRPPKSVKGLRWKVTVKGGRMTMSHPDVVEYVRKNVPKGVPLADIAARLGTTEPRVRRMCRDLQIPYPRGGKWAKVPFDWIATPGQ